MVERMRTGKGRILILRKIEQRSHKTKDPAWMVDGPVGAAVTSPESDSGMHKSFEE